MRWGKASCKHSSQAKKVTGVDGHGQHHIWGRQGPGRVDLVGGRVDGRTFHDAY